MFWFHKVTPIGVAIECSFVAERIECAHDFAAIAAADGAHEVFEGFRPILKSGLDRVKATALEARRLRYPHFETRGRAHGPSQVESGLGADAAAHERRVDRNRA